ncbi:MULTISPECIES: metallophosphoesterase family protein [unclassified Shinella]|uniref:metallophosphoesterase family protein n=1 Tax=unclassified Shinella TaxID=2643062 RepID=UPI00225C9288|nr:metallophosphoesterase [Shinella sp. YE25]MDC7259279.1 metallophosphoesterase [Shinella sp. YE25]CAI0336068.1 Calcineurin-like phosphoesterase family protein [Rhizobiaceae bacterium]CAK7261457.1 Calcineurin-like phosphoesterase family protein [Shinella sp. WSC3-e]
MIRIAVIADPHVHDCAWIPEGSGLPGAIRSFAETAASTRVFNESIPAFRAALDHVAAAGVKTVLLVGDLTDDGQRPNIRAALDLVAEYRERHGIRVLMTPGNHDFYALAGRPQDKSFLMADGRSLLLRSADCPEAATLGTAEALAMLSGLGFMPEAGDLHWESPFGTDPAWEARSYEAVSPDGGTRCRMIDSSYLVEPVEGLWVLAIDANVCVPRDGAEDLADPGEFHDPTDGGWRAVLAHRAHLLAWMADVATRAKARGKRLVAFSHYPALDPLGGVSSEEVALFGPTGLARRAPTPAVADAFAATGVSLHFSGHLHVNDTARHETGAGRFVNIAVPSPVGYGPGLKIVDLCADRSEIRTLSLRQVPGHDAAFAAYRTEAAREGAAEPAASSAPDHGTFLSRHLVNLVHGRYLAREWPRDMVEFVRTATVADLLETLGLAAAGAPAFGLNELVEDWYRLRKAGELSQADIASDRLAFYRDICARAPHIEGDGLPARFSTLLRMMRAYLERPPNRDFSLSLPDLVVRAL